MRLPIQFNISKLHCDEFFLVLFIDVTSILASQALIPTNGCGSEDSASPTGHICSMLNNEPLAVSIPHKEMKQPLARHCQFLTGVDLWSRLRA